MKFVVNELHANQRIDVVLSEHTHLGSRSKVTKLIKENKVVLDGKNIKPSYRCELGDVFEIPDFDLIESRDVGLKPMELPLDILFEDKDIVVVNKPPGLVMHPAAGHEQDTLVNALIHHCSDLSMGTGENRPGIIHRLDKDTSGVLVIAKNNATHESIAKQFKDRTTERIYQAVIYGHPTFDEKTVESYFIRHPKNRKKFISAPEAQKDKGKRAVTHIKILHRLPSGLTVIQCQLETGRTHQIRIHTSDLGHPIVGDQVYGSHKRAKELKSVKTRKEIESMNRIALHATTLGFTHPGLGETVRFVKPWPADLHFLWSGIL
ncbi:MAG: RluA family pseudouridine synthase [Bdellovibrionales bacterium]